MMNRKSTSLPLELVVVAIALLFTLILIIVFAGGQLTTLFGGMSQVGEAATGNLTETTGSLFS